MRRPQSNLVKVADARATRAGLGDPPKLPPLRSHALTRLQLMRLCVALNRRLRRGCYLPTLAYRTYFPKRTGGLRTVTILTTEDRMMYETLLRPLRPDIERTLASSGVLFGPRGMTSGLRWSSFLRSPLRSDHGFVVVADVADTFAHLSHRCVAQALEQSGADASATVRLTEFLSGVMGEERGLPLDLPASWCLMTAVLAGVDRDLVARGWCYARCSDDIRIAVADPAQASDALTDLESSLDGLGMRLRADRTRVMERSEYRDAEALDRLDSIWEVLSLWSDGRLLHSAPLALARGALRRARATGSVRQAALGAVIDALRVKTSEDAPEPVLHPQVAFLTSAGDPALICHVPDLLLRCRTLTPLIARYLRVLLATAGDRSLRAGSVALLSGELLPIQQASIYRALVPVAPAASAGLLAHASNALIANDADWTLRTEAARFLASAAAQPRRLRDLASAAPTQFAAEIIGIAEGRGLRLPC